jgi:hypothetical protein
MAAHRFGIEEQNVSLQTQSLNGRSLADGNIREGPWATPQAPWPTTHSRKTRLSGCRIAAWIGMVLSSLLMWSALMWGLLAAMGLVS